MKTIHFDSLYSASYYFDIMTHEGSFVDQLNNFIKNEFQSFVLDVDSINNDNDIAISDFAQGHGFDKWYSDGCLRHFEDAASNDDFHKFNALWDKVSKSEQASEKLEQLERLLSDALSLASEIEELIDDSTEEEE